jgi:DNA-binding NarL/FixJ family response regulator
MKLVFYWDERLTVQALGALLQARGNFEVAGSSDDLHECLVMLREKNANVLIAKSSLIGDGPKAMLMGATLVSPFGVVLIGEKVSGLDAAAVLDLNASDDELVVALSKFQGQVKPSGSRTRKTSLLGLSRREHDIALMVSRGYSNRRISEATGLREQTVKNLVSTVIRRMGCENRTQVALRFASSEASQ